VNVAGALALVLSRNARRHPGRHTQERDVERDELQLRRPQRRVLPGQRAVADVVARQRAAGLDVIGDGEQSKTGFFAYIGQRLSGFEPRPGRDPLDTFRAEIDAFPEYYEQYLKGAMAGGMAAPAVPLGCTGPVACTGEERLRRDLENLRAAAGDAGPDDVFVCAVAPSGVGGNEYYPSQAAYLDAVADAPASTRSPPPSPEGTPTPTSPPSCT
jgi:hypothetical protein